MGTKRSSCLSISCLLLLVKCTVDGALRADSAHEVVFGRNLVTATTLHALWTTQDFTAIFSPDEESSQGTGEYRQQ
jgi:hypothetical protein